jgi:hypothetical protein
MYLITSLTKVLLMTKSLSALPNLLPASNLQNASKENDIHWGPLQARKKFGSFTGEQTNDSLGFSIKLSLEASKRVYYHHICLSVRMEQLGSHWMHFYYIWNLSFFRKSTEKIQVSLRSDKNNATLHEDVFAFIKIFRWILLRMRNISNKDCR